jgi:hypothetical protein
VRGLFPPHERRGSFCYGFLLIWRRKILPMDQPFS